MSSSVDVVSVRTIQACVIRDTTESDIEAICQLNRSAVPAVNDVPRDFLARLLGKAMYYRVACLEDAVCGFLLVLGPGHEYDSPNYQFFLARHDRFAYVDRIVIAADVRGRGIGAALYTDLVRTVKDRVPRVCCEVNVTPPNPASSRFHAKTGFVEVGRQKTEHGTKVVALLEWELGS